MLEKEDTGGTLQGRWVRGRRQRRASRELGLRSKAVARRRLEEEDGGGALQGRGQGSGVLQGRG
jgi:hypothetical protein